MIDKKDTTAVSAADVEEIRTLFLRQAAGETAHDIRVIEAVLAHTPPGQPVTHSFLIKEFAIRIPDGWRISSIVPVPAQ
jgi:hypothetical protein